MDASEPPSTNATGGNGQTLLVDVVRREPRWDDQVGDAQLRKAIQVAFDTAGDFSGPAEVSLLLTDDEEIRTLNATWRMNDKPTNVLSFPMDDAQQGTSARHLGDIVLAFDTVSREAEDKRMPVSQHATHLVVHGLLHLLGYDHETTDEAERMEALEARILATFGLPDPYREPVLEEGDVR